MSPLNAAVLIGSLYNYGGAPQKTFIFVDLSWKFTMDASRLAEIGNFPLSYLKGSIGIVPSYGNISDFVEYFSSLNPENSPYTQFVNYWQQTFRCIYVPVGEKATLPICPSNMRARTANPFNCTCSGSESLQNVNIDGDVAYVQDSVLAYVNALQTIKNVVSLVLSKVDAFIIYRIAPAFMALIIACYPN